MKFITDENEHNVQQCSPFQHQTIYILIEQKKNNSYFQYVVLIVALTKNLSKWTYSVFFEEVDEDEDSFTEEDEDLRRRPEDGRRRRKKVGVRVFYEIVFVEEKKSYCTVRLKKRKEWIMLFWCFNLLN